MNQSKDIEKMPLLSHITELRNRLIFSIITLIIGFFISLLFYDYIIAILFKPLMVLTSSLDENVLYINTIFEGFIVRLKISAISGLVLTLPVHTFNLIRFIFPGLHKKERRVISISLYSSFFFIIASFFYSYYTILPVSIQFLTSKGFIPENTGMILSFGGNISYILQFILASLIIFQIPIILEILLVLNILSRKVLLRSGRYVIVLFFIMSALLTPPDFVTQIGLALPLTGLYYLTIVIAKIFGFGERKKCLD
jgi:sec-independent protein translocase protein TatC